MAFLARTAQGGISPDRRLAAVQTLLRAVPAESMVALLLNRLEHDSDTHMLWPCATWLVELYGEVAAARKVLLNRLEGDPNPAMRRSVLQLLSARFGACEPVRNAVALVAALDPDDDIRAAAGKTVEELRRIMYSPPAPAQTSHSSRQLAAWQATSRP
ncbi:MAG TPA: hypothetical protein VF657_01675 [Actinoplanes sp.]